MTMGEAAKPATGPVMVPNAPPEAAENETAEPVPPKGADKGADKPAAPGEVVSLDSFRKK